MPLGRGGLWQLCCQTGSRGGRLGAGGHGAVTAATAIRRGASICARSGLHRSVLHSAVLRSAVLLVAVLHVGVMVGNGAGGPRLHVAGRCLGDLQLPEKHAQRCYGG